jgi:RNA polymerase sigma factor (TIGR02999 family)
VGDVTRLLQAWTAGHPEALGLVLELLETQLRQLARQQLRRRPARSVASETELLHEVFLGFLERINRGEAVWLNRQQFLAHVALSMRGVLVDAMRASNAAKRGGGVPHVPLDAVVIPDRQASHRHAALYIALERLERAMPSHYQAFVYSEIVGLTGKEAAALLGIHRSTLINRVQLASAFLKREMTGMTTPELEAVVDALQSR